jgi:hypothetical protein
MWMIQRGDTAGFALETLGELFLGNFDCHGAAQSRVARFVDVPHAATAEERHDFVGAEASSSGENQGREPPIMLTVERRGYLRDPCNVPGLSRRSAPPSAKRKTRVRPGTAASSENPALQRASLCVLTR